MIAPLCSQHHPAQAQVLESPALDRNRRANRHARNTYVFRGDSGSAFSGFQRLRYPWGGSEPRFLGSYTHPCPRDGIPPARGPRAGPPSVRSTCCALTLAHRSEPAPGRPAGYAQAGSANGPESEPSRGPEGCFGALSGALSLCEIGVFDSASEVCSSPLGASENCDLRFLIWCREFGADRQSQNRGSPCLSSP